MSSYPPPPSPDPYGVGGTPPTDPYGTGGTPPTDPYVPQAPAGATPPGAGYPGQAPTPYPPATAPAGWAAPGSPGYPDPAAAPYPGPPAPHYGAPAPAGTDGVSIAALVTGVLGLGPIPLVLGIVGVRRTGKTGRGGKGLAIAGIVLGALSTLAWATFILLVTFLATNDDARDAFQEGLQEGWQQGATVDVGTCLNIPDDPSNIGEATEADCTGSHTAEVIATTLLTEDAFPGDDAVFDAAEEYCTGAFAGYVGVPWEESTLDMYYGLPTSTTWKLGDRQIVCYVTPTDDSPLTASVAGSGM